MKNLPEELKHIVLLGPQLDGALTSDAVSMKNFNKGWIKVVMKQAHAAQCTITLGQATVVALTDGKALTNAVRIWANSDVSVNDLLTAQTAAKLWQFSATLKTKVVWFEIDPANAFDVSNDFDVIYLTSGASNVANVLSADFYGDPKTKAAVLEDGISD